SLGFTRAITSKLKGVLFTIINIHTFVISFMLFALIFRSGYFIYPPTLGIDSGTSYIASISRFVIFGVVLPILAVSAISFVRYDPRELVNRVHPWFGLFFTSLVYLAIGPFFGIPRAATVAYEMSINPFMSEANGRGLFIFTTIFFVLVYLVSLNPSKMVDRIGQVLTPILLLAIIIMSVGGFFLLKGPTETPHEKYASAPF